MEISLREWLVIGGVIVIALIVFDGWRRVRGGRNSLRMDIDRRMRDMSDGPADDHGNPELPYGGARMVGRAQMAEPQAAPAKPAPAYRNAAPHGSHERYDSLERHGSHERHEHHERIEPTFGGAHEVPAPSKAQVAEPAVSAGRPVPAEPQVPSFEPLDGFDELDDFDDDLGRPRPARAVGAEQPAPHAEPDVIHHSHAEPVVGPFAHKPLDEVDPLFDEVPDDYAPPAATQPAPEVAQQPDAEPETPAFDLEKPIPMLMQRTRKVRDDEPPDAAPLQQSEMPLGPAPEPEPAPKSVQKPRPARVAAVDAKEQPQQDSLFAEPESSSADHGDFVLPDPENVLVITVVSTDAEGFPGGGLKRILEACDLHLGSMNIFHRYEEGTDRGPVQFSMANAVNPGTFDPASIETLHTPGVSFFMSMEQPQDVMNAFECMLATAETLARHLNGDLLDENRSVLRPQTKEHYRQRIRDFEMHNRSRRSASRA